ncbi:VF530 family DNA-binding protein [Leucothrix arctica]|uniref:DUF2132 domain-containing protein n=1 Tax=Leucothrix arctica TaxID=1481894 RepID=A0A317CG82_9GAMM|nr:VF530 family DNA-binding protein [Leucothrix arctica]PWQ95232.1 hypothetical protein DKT75_12875 [Leucothrix arctica]
MSEENLYLNNPLHGVGTKTVLNELVSHYGFDVLFAHLNINCFRANPSLAASYKFLKKTDWAREKVEVFYLYKYKNLPAVSSEQFKLPPRERIVPEHHVPGEPAVLTVEDGQYQQEKREERAAQRDSYSGARKGSSRDYNEQRSAGYFKDRDSKPSFYGSDDSDSDTSSFYKGGSSASRNQGNSKPSFYKSDSDSRDSKPSPYKADVPSQDSKPSFYKADVPAEDSKPSFYKAKVESQDAKPSIDKSGESLPSKSTHYKSAAADDSVADTKPTPAKDPWGNFKGGDADE